MSPIELVLGAQPKNEAEKVLFPTLYNSGCCPDFCTLKSTLFIVFASRIIYH